MTNTTDVLDLDALVPQIHRIKYQGNEIEVQPPKVSDLLRMSSLGKRMESIDSLSDDEVDALVVQMTDAITRIIPELKDQPLSTPQLLKLMEVIVDMSTPPDTKELQEQGITPADDKSPKA